MCAKKCGSLVESPYSCTGQPESRHKIWHDLSLFIDQHGLFHSLLSIPISETEQSIPQLKMSALSLAWQEEHGGAKPARGRFGKSDGDIPTMVRKALADNFQGWSEAEIYHIKHDGQSLYDVLYAAKQAWVKSKSIKHGPFFYENLRTKYSCESRPWHQIKIPDIEEVPSALLDALEAHLHHKKGPLIAYAESLSEVQSESQLKTLMVALSKLRPQTSQQQLSVAMSLLEALARLKAFDLYPDTLSIMRPVIDETLLQAGL